MIRKLAAVITWVLSPLLIPTYAAILLLYTGFQFSMFSWPAKRFLLLVIFVSTAVMPSLTLLISYLGKNLQISEQKVSDSRVPLIFVALYYYIGFYLLNKMPLYAIFKIFLLAGAILVIVLIMVSLFVKIDERMAALGGVFGMMVALALRIGYNPLLLMSAIVLISGVVGTATMIRHEQTTGSVLAGFPTGFAVFFLIFYLL
jgi:hypothetical protein